MANDALFAIVGDDDYLVRNGQKKFLKNTLINFLTIFPVSKLMVELTELKMWNVFSTKQKPPDKPCPYLGEENLFG